MLYEHYVSYKLLISYEVSWSWSVSQSIYCDEGEKLERAHDLSDHTAVVKLRVIFGLYEKLKLLSTFLWETYDWGSTWREWTVITSPFYSENVSLWSIWLFYIIFTNFIISLSWVAQNIFIKKAGRVAFFPTCTSCTSRLLCTQHTSIFLICCSSPHQDFRLGINRVVDLRSSWLQLILCKYNFEIVSDLMNASAMQNLTSSFNYKSFPRNVGSFLHILFKQISISDRSFCTMSSQYLFQAC